jgi:hypothetical protein
MEDKTCIECDEIIHGRADKKFCSDQCRNCYNNRRNSENNNFMRNVNGILRRNRRILADLTPDGKVTLPREKLSDYGYNFGFYTNTYINKKGTVYYFCYEYGVLPHNNLVTIVHRKGEKVVDKES